MTTANDPKTDAETEAKAKAKAEIEAEAKPIKPKDWPEMWSKDEKFWRETATRTIAAVVSVVILTIPVIIYNLIFKNADLALLGQTAIGLGLFGVAALPYWISRKVKPSAKPNKLKELFKRRKGLKDETGSVTASFLLVSTAFMLVLFGIAFFVTPQLLTLFVVRP